MGYETFEELVVYKSAREFRKEIYNLIKSLPEEEKYNLVSQMRRAATSLTNNIAEGAGITTRKTSSSAANPAVLYQSLLTTRISVRIRVIFLGPVCESF
jgi:hypothetical protein